MNFLKTFLAALLAFVVANILIFIFFMMIFAGITAAMGPTTEQVRPNSVLHLDLVNGITDEPNSGPVISVGLMGIEVDNSNSLLELIGAVEHAAYDSNIKGIYLNFTGGRISLANIEELRAALIRFKQQSGKFIIAYKESYGQMGYYLASVADKVFINP